MRILILGAQGMLGSELVRAFSDKHEVLAWGKNELDITDAADVAKKITSDIDVIINAAGITDEERAETETEGVMKVNAYPVGSLADICNMLGMVFVTFSSEAVFPGKNVAGYREKDATEPLSAYGRGKALAEKFALEDNDQTYLIRTSRLFGNHPKSGSYLDTVRESLGKGTEFGAVHDEVASPTYVNDVVEKVRELVEQKKPFGTYHVVNSGYATWYQFAQKVAELTGSKTPVMAQSRKDVPSAVVRPRYGMLQNTRLPQLRSWEEALNEYLNGLTKQK